MTEKIKVTIEGEQRIKAKRTIELSREDYERYLQLRHEQGDTVGDHRFFQYCNDLGEDWLSDPVYIYDWDEWDYVEIKEIAND